MFCGNLMLATWFSSQIENLETFLATSRLEKNYHFHCTGAESRDLRAQGKDLAIFGSRTVAVASTGGVDDHLLAEMFFFSANLVVESPLKNDAWKTILCIFGALCNFSRVESLSSFGRVSVSKGKLQLPPVQAEYPAIVGGNLSFTVHFGEVRPGVNRFTPFLLRHAAFQKFTEFRE